MAGNDNVVRLRNVTRAEPSARRLVPDRLIEARFASRLTQTELASRIGVSRQAVSAYEQGEKSPEPPVLLKIASELGQPVAHFTKETRRTFGRHTAKFFRKKGADTRRRNQACDVLADWFAGTAYAFDHIANFPQVDLPSFEPRDAQSPVYQEDEIEELAEEVRKYFGLGLGPISNVVRLLETRGVIICRFVIPNENVEAFSYWSGERPLIFLSSDKRSAARARFDAAHELAHLCLHKWVGEDEVEDEDRLRQIEAEADRFAGSFLLPRKSFPMEVYSPRADSFVDLKVRWKVSIQAMVYRCKDLGIFDDRQITNLYKQISFKKWRTVEPLDTGSRALPMEDPLLLKRVAELVFESGRYAVDEFRSDIGLSDEILEQLIGVKLPRKSGEEFNFSPTLK
jgi:Zn-dependent peptidase ImmA (M78 family)/DNA-binding XRE family transcriptional regulator